MVGIEAHLENIQSLMMKDYDGAMMVGICGRAGIGKTTIARALHSRLSTSFELTCFMENIRESCNNRLDEYGLELSLQEQLLSKLINQHGMRIYHLCTMPERLCHLKVLIILDGVDDLKLLEAFADEPTWFGPGSRIIVTTQDQELLEQHDIYNTYHVGCPSSKEALEILCKYAFRKRYPHNRFKELAESVVDLCGNLPLGLSVLGSYLRGEKTEEWAKVIRRLVTIIDS